MMQQMLQEDKDDLVRETVVRNLALLLLYVDDVDKFSKVWLYFIIYFVILIVLKFLLMYLLIFIQYIYIVFPNIVERLRYEAEKFEL